MILEKKRDATGGTGSDTVGKPAPKYGARPVGDRPHIVKRPSGSGSSVEEGSTTADDQGKGAVDKGTFLMKKLNLKY